MAQGVTSRANVGLSRRRFIATAGAALASMPTAKAVAQTVSNKGVLFENVRIFQGTEKLSEPSNVLVVGKSIRTISTKSIDIQSDLSVSRIAGGGRTLVPGLIDAHTHIMFATIPMLAALTSDVGFANVAAVKEAGDTLMRGFTSIRDLGGPSFGLKKAIDLGIVPGPRIWPSGAFISQTGGHGDFRLPNDFPARPGELTFTERAGATIIADSPDAVRRAAREQLALGASQIKMMAGGGVSSVYDPLDVTQYTVAELRAGVEAAENWGTYATVHAYTPKAVKQAVEAGVRCIEHGNLLDDETVTLMADKGIWWCLQPFLDDQEATPFPPGSANRKKQLQMFAGTDTAYELAKKYKIRTAWGSDTLFDASIAKRQGAQLAKLTRWYSSAQVLKMATADNAELLALSGLRSPYEGKLGVVQEGAFADLILMDGDPIANIEIIENPEEKFVVIMKDGNLFKNSLA